MALFWDLAAFPVNCDKQCREQVLSMLQALDFDGYAVETVVSTDHLHKHLSKWPRHEKEQGEETSVNRLHNDNPKAKALKCVTRLTVKIDSAAALDLVGASHSPALRHFDLLCVIPSTSESFAAACHRNDLDIISIDASARLEFTLKPSLVNEAFKRGIVFELRYSDALLNQTCKRYFLSNASMLIRACRGRGFICSSGSKNPMHLRGHHDIANLMVMCGVNGLERAIWSVGKTCCEVIRRARLRRLDRSAMLVGSHRDPCAQDCPAQIKSLNCL